MERWSSKDASDFPYITERICLKVESNKTKNLANILHQFKATKTSFTTHVFQIKNVSFCSKMSVDFRGLLLTRLPLHVVFRSCIFLVNSREADSKNKE